MFLKNHAQLQVLRGWVPFFCKKYAQKNPLKNKKKCHFAKNSLKVAQNQEQASEQASQVNQASQAI